MLASVKDLNRSTTWTRGCWHSWQLREFILGCAVLPGAYAKHPLPAPSMLCGVLSGLVLALPVHPLLPSVSRSCPRGRIWLSWCANLFLFRVEVITGREGAVTGFLTSCLLLEVKWEAPGDLAAEFPMSMCYSIIQKHLSMCFHRQVQNGDQGQQQPWGAQDGPRVRSLVYLILPCLYLISVSSRRVPAVQWKLCPSGQQTRLPACWVRLLSLERGYFIVPLPLLCRGL